MTVGINVDTGAQLAGFEHLCQSVRDILFTPKGSRVLRRDYGSEIPRLIDAPMNPGLLIDLYTATADALDLWEPRLELSRVSIVKASSGALEFRLPGLWYWAWPDTLTRPVEILL